LRAAKGLIEINQAFARKRRESGDDGPLDPLSIMFGQIVEMM